MKFGVSAVSVAAACHSSAMAFLLFFSIFILTLLAIPCNCPQGKCHCGIGVHFQLNTEVLNSSAGQSAT